MNPHCFILVSFGNDEAFNGLMLSGGKYFHHDNGIDRKLDNYYDVVQLLSVHNINKYNPVEVTVDGIDIKIPELAHEKYIYKHIHLSRLLVIYMIKLMSKYWVLKASFWKTYPKKTGRLPIEGENGNKPS